MRPMALYMAAEQLRAAADAMRRADKALEGSDDRLLRAEAQKLREDARCLHALADRWQDTSMLMWDEFWESSRRQL